MSETADAARRRLRQVVVHELDGWDAGIHKARRSFKYDPAWWTPAILGVARRATHADLLGMVAAQQALGLRFGPSRAGPTRAPANLSAVLGCLLPQLPAWST
jgi:hypothetical protein